MKHLPTKNILLDIPILVYGHINTCCGSWDCEKADEDDDEDDDENPPFLKVSSSSACCSADWPEDCNTNKLNIKSLQHWKHYTLPKFSLESRNDKCNCNNSYIIHNEIKLTWTKHSEILPIDI